MARFKIGTTARGVFREHGTAQTHAGVSAAIRGMLDGRYSSDQISVIDTQPDGGSQEWEAYAGEMNAFVQSNGSTGSFLGDLLGGFFGR